MLDMIAGFTSALSTLKTLTDAVNTVASAELRIELNSKIADLQSQILSAQQQMLDMQGRYEAVLAENTALKDAEWRRVEAKPEMMYGCYIFDGDRARLPGLLRQQGQEAPDQPRRYAVPRVQRVSRGDRFRLGGALLRGGAPRAAALGDVSDVAPGPLWDPKSKRPAGGGAVTI